MLNRLLIIIQYRIFQLYFIILNLFVKKSKFEYLFKKFISNKQPYNIVIIGAHDGKSHDNIYELIKSDRLNGIFVEPNKIYFTRLKKNFEAFSKIEFENIAIHNTKSYSELHYVDEKAMHQYPDWTNGIGSFNINHLLKHNIKPEHITSDLVICKSLMELINEKAHIKPLRFLQIDTEGYDFEIIKSIDFKVVRPKMIKFEHVNLTKSEIQEALLFLQKQFYFSFFLPHDIIAVNPFHFFRS